MSWYIKTSFLQTMQLSNLIVRKKKKKKLRSIYLFKAFPYLVFQHSCLFFGEQQSRWTLFGSQIMTFIPHELCISVFSNFVDYCGYILL